MCFSSLPGWVKGGRRGHWSSFLAGLLSDGFVFSLWPWQMFDDDTLPCGVPAVSPVFPSKDVDEGLFSSSCFPSSASVFLGVYCILTPFVGLHYSSRSFWAGFKIVPGLLCLTLRIHLVPRKNSCDLCTDKLWMHKPALSLLLQRISVFCPELEMCPCVSKPKIKVSRWFHWSCLFRME